VRLFEYPDFDQATLQAAEHFQSQGLRPAIIEKDYYVTEGPCIIAASGGRLSGKSQGPPRTLGRFTASSLCERATA
jgi:hypothetical protein